jgi:hypothetical protein
MSSAMLEISPHHLHTCIHYPTQCVPAVAAAEPIPPCSEKVSSAMFFKYNTQLGPPYQVLVDTNFINFSIKNKVGQAW